MSNDLAFFIDPTCITRVAAQGAKFRYDAVLPKESFRFPP